LALFDFKDRETEAMFHDLVKATADAPEATPCQDNPDPYIAPWSSKPTASRESAEDLCIDCPFMIQCRDYARAAGEPYGVWGGERPVDRGIPANYRA